VAKRPTVKVVTLEGLSLKKGKLTAQTQLHYCNSGEAFIRLTLARISSPASLLRGHDDGQGRRVFPGPRKKRSILAVGGRAQFLAHYSRDVVSKHIFVISRVK